MNAFKKFPLFPCRCLTRLFLLFSCLSLFSCMPKGEGEADQSECREDQGSHGSKRTCASATETSTVTSTSTSTSTGTATGPTSTATSTDLFPELPGRACVVDRFRQGSGEQAVKKVDILFMMDHSGSMQDDWERVANNMKELVRQLRPDTDIRYAVILGDVGSWRGKIYSPYGVKSPVLSNQTQTVQEVSRDLHKIFVEGMKVSDSGSGEALFYSLYHAVTTRAAANQKLGFFRPDAALSVIFMSDEQEIGFPFPGKAELAAQGLPSRCDESFEDSVKHHYYDAKGITLDATFNALRALKGDMPVKAHAFINLTKEDLFRRNSKNAKCLYDSLGYGYSEMVARTKGVLFSIQEDKAVGLAQCGKAIRESLELQHDFALSNPTDKVDPATILSAVDGSLVAYEYRPASGSVHLENAGRAESLIEIRHCEPDGRVAWTLTGFGGTPDRYSVGLSWQTTEYATGGKVLWGTDAAALVHRFDDVNVSSGHSVTVSGLAPNTLYYFQAVSWDEYGQVRSSDVRSFRTLPDWSLSAVNGQAARSSASVSWSTPEYPTKGRLLWGLSPDALSSQSAETATASDHHIEVSGLAPDTVYYFQCRSRDEFGLEKQSDVFPLRTAADWGITGFAGQATRFSVALAWSTPEQVTDGKVLWGLSPGDLIHQVAAPGSGNSHAVTVAGLSPGTDYYFQAVSSDGLTEKQSAVILVRTAVDWSVTGFAGVSTQTDVTLSWSTPGYDTNGRVLWGLTDSALTNVAVGAANGSSHGLTIGGLSPDTVYYFQAASTDADGMEKRSAVVAIRTQQVPLPTWSITGFAGAATTDSVTLSWNTDQYGTAGKVLWGGALDQLSHEALESASGTIHSVTVAGLAPDTLYYFQAVSSDDRGQEKASDVIAVRTLATPAPDPSSNWVIVGLDGTTTPTEASLIWQTPGALTKAVVRVGLSPSDLTALSVDVTLAAETHQITIPGLTPSTAYYFQVIASDANGRTVESAIIAKTTKAP